jgi:hypothetical protein
LRSLEAALFAAQTGLPVWAWLLIIIVIVVLLIRR